jgi:hypothetical protein
MPVLEHHGGLVVYRVSLDPREVPHLLQEHRLSYPGCCDLEGRARQLKENDFQPDACLHFVEQVYRWSKSVRNLSHVLNAGPDEIASRLRAATKQIDAEEETRAVETLAGIPHVGISYASKIARFLDPSRCVILDSIIREHIGYPDDLWGYEAFLRDCNDAVHMLKASPSLDPECRERLRVCDVEAALFMNARKNRNVRP